MLEVIMAVYTHFVGIDIGKFTFVVSVHGARTTIEYQHSAAGIAQFIREHTHVLSDALCIVEPTGGYERDIIEALRGHHHHVHRADTRKVKSFIRSFGSGAKTDALDAKALARYGYERSATLALYVPQPEHTTLLQQLLQRRTDLMGMLVAEKNRFHAASGIKVRDSIRAMIAVLEQNIQAITEQIKELIAQDHELTKKLEILKTVPGIGAIISFELLLLLPELGTLCRRKIASLAGLAPCANDSGKRLGYRRTGRGRERVKSVLFLAAMAAARSKTSLKEYYERLRAKGKHKMVALTALMRKILVIANARLKEMYANAAA